MMWIRDPSKNSFKARYRREVRKLANIGNEKKLLKSSEKPAIKQMKLMMHGFSLHTKALFKVCTAEVLSFFGGNY